MTRGSAAGARSPFSGRTEPTVDRLTRAITLAMVRHRRLVLALSLLVLGVSIALASRLRIDGDFARLLPSESPTARRFFETLERKGGGSSTIVVVIESPDAASNQRMADEVERRLRAERLPGVRSVEAGPGEVREFFRKNRWLFAKVTDLERVDCELERELERRTPGYLGLDEEGCDPKSAGSPPAPPPATLAGGGDTPLARIRSELEARLREVDRFSTGYYRTAEGDAFAVIVRADSAGMGDAGSEGLLSAVQRVVGSASVSGRHPQTLVGFGGDIPTSIAEQNALIEDVTVVSLAALILILGSIIVFFRSPIVLLEIGLCVAVGCAVTFAVAALVYGRLNAATSFLASIIAGNGINPAIVYIARFRELCARGESLEDAAADAAISCRAGTLTAALAASGAYAALLTTSFRAFSEFGFIGFVGTLACWTATFLVCPAAVAVTGGLAAPARAAGKRRLPSLARGLAALAVSYPRAVLLGGILFTAALVLPIPGYLKDPWEYNFSRLRSKVSATSGASRASNVVDRILQSRGSPLLLLADDAGSAAFVAAEVRRADRESGRAPIVEKVETLRDRLGGEPEEVAQKLAVSARLRDRIDKIAKRLPEDDRRFVEEWRPPDDLAPLSADDLPELLTAQFREANGRLGTPVYVTLDSQLSQSRGENLLRISDLLEDVHLPDGKVAPNASRAAVFAEMIRAMSRDGPRATLLALFVVVVMTVVVARRLGVVLAVLGSLVFAVTWTVGAMAALDVRLNFLNFVALPLTFGIGVEYAINLFERIRISDDVHSALRSAGGPVLLCSLTTIFGYGSVLFADNRALASFGTYAITGEIACVTTALLVMPAGLLLLGRASGNGGRAAVTG